MWKPKEKEMIKNFEERLVDLIGTEAVGLCESHKNDVLKACDVLCGKTRSRSGWWNGQVKVAIDRKKSLIRWCENRSVEIKSDYRRARKKKVVTKAIKLEAEEEMNVLCNKLKVEMVDL